MGVKGIRIRAFAGLLSVLAITAVSAVTALAGAETIALVIPRAEALSHIRIDNFGTVNDHFYRGSQPKGHDYADLAALGVKTVIDLQEDGPSNEAGLVQHAGMQFFRIPMTTSDAPATNQIARFFSIMNDPANQPVYVHCAGGRHRTGTMTALYRMTFDGWTADRAYGEMKRYHFESLFGHPALKNFVFGYKPAQPAQAGSPATGVQPEK